jgi:hypothetical protein
LGSFIIDDSIVELKQIGSIIDRGISWMCPSGRSSLRALLEETVDEREGAVGSRQFLRSLANGWGESRRLTTEVIALEEFEQATPIGHGDGSLTQLETESFVLQLIEPSQQKQTRRLKRWMLLEQLLQVLDSLGVKQFGMMDVGR